MKYKRVQVRARGGPEMMHVVEEECRPPSSGEVRVRVLAAPVSLPDVEARDGRTPFPPRIPFTPGYAVIGSVDALGEGVHDVVVGDRVGALTVYGGYAEVVYLKPAQLIRVPSTVDPVQAAPLILNYIVAYQCLHRLAKVESGKAALIIGASGGIGTAFLQLGRLAELEMIAIASESKHHVLAEYGAFPLDYRTQDVVQAVRGLRPEGLDVVFDGVGGDYIQRGFGLLRRGGKLVTYANPNTLQRTFLQLGQILLFNLLPNGRSAGYYSTGKSRVAPGPFMEDWATLFRLLEDDQIEPILAATFPVAEAAAANALLESGGVIGNIVLVAPELLLYGD